MPSTFFLSRSYQVYIPVNMNAKPRNIKYLDVLDNGNHHAVLACLGCILGFIAECYFVYAKISYHLVEIFNVGDIFII